MSGLAGIIHWTHPSVDPVQLDQMLRLIRHRGPDGVDSDIRAHVGLGRALLALTKAEKNDKQPVWLPDGSCGIVADARLYNRPALYQQLRHTRWLVPRSSDAALILAAYERWGASLLERLEGDFAFALWDVRHHQLFAARDPFGIKPFFYHWNPAGFRFGSEPKQLLTLAEVPITPDEGLIGELLTNRFADPERTFFAGIARLRPGHSLLATCAGVGQHRYWTPDPAHEIRYPNPSDYIEHFGALFRNAVSKRLHSDFPIGIDLSGGLDSSSIVLMAAALRRTTALPPIATLSATYADLPCDESVYIRAITDISPFQSHLFCPLSVFAPLHTSLPTDVWQTDSPRADLQRSTSEGRARFLSGLGAKSLLTGVGGDELVHQEAYLRDLARRKRFIRLWRGAWYGAQNSWNSFAWLLTDALKAIVPESAKRLYRHVQTPQLPGWLNSDFLASVKHHQQTTSLPSPRGFQSLTQELVFQAFCHPAMWRGLEFMECQASYDGYEIRHPFLDRPLVEFVLAMPFAQRPFGGQWKALLYHALAPQLPPQILERHRKTSFESYVHYVWRQEERQLAALLFSTDQWNAEPYVSRAAAAQLLDCAAQQDSIPAFLTAWRIIGLELWLRCLPQYHTRSISKL